MLFLKILLTEFIAEMGDKTQLMLIAMTSKFKVRDIVLGTAVAVLVLNGLAVLAGGLVGSLVPAWLIKIIAALAFLYFAFTSLKKDDDEEEDAEAENTTESDEAINAETAEDGTVSEESAAAARETAEGIVDAVRGARYVHMGEKKAIK